MKRFFKKIYNYFVQKKVIKSLPDTAVIKNDLADPRLWGFVVAHTKKKVGAVLKDEDGTVMATENDHSNSTSIQVCRQIPSVIATRDAGGLDGAYGWLSIEGCKFSIESHGNAFNRNAKGYLILVIDGDKASEYVANLMLESFREKYPKRQYRGIRRVQAGDNGFLNLRKAREAGMEVALLTEMFFIDNRDDYISSEDLGNFYVDFIRSFDS